MARGQSREKENLFKVRFQSKDDKQPLEVVVKSVGSSEFLGLLSLEGFVFSDQTKQVILPAEDEARKRFSKVKRLYIPYHNILFIEEYKEEEPDLRKLPFIKEVSSDSTSQVDLDN